MLCTFAKWQGAMDMQAVLADTELTAPAGASLGTAFTRAFRRLGDTRPDFDFVCANSSGRAAAERYVSECFARTYGASISSYMPLLLTMRCANELSSVAGVRAALTGPLFLENYLHQPVEVLLSEKTAQPVRRANIFELGNLAANRPGLSFMLYVVLANVMYRAGYDYAVFTATRQVARVVDKLNFSTFALAEANPDCLGSSASDWGSYYQNNPQVMAVDLRSSMQVFAGQPLQAITARLFAPEINSLVNSVSAPSH